MDPIPSSQWAQVCQENGTVEYIKTPVPQAGPDELLIKIEYTGVCHSDLRLQKGLCLPSLVHLVVVSLTSVHRWVATQATSRPCW